MRRPDHEDYDPSSVHIHPHEFNKLSPGMRQYWKIKQDYFDSVVMVRFGKWYFVYYYDIIALNEVSDKPINLNYQYHGMHHSERETYIKRFVQRGYQVVVVEQTETTNMMIKQLERKDEDGNRIIKRPYIVNREVDAIHTIGTYQSVEEKCKITTKLDQIIHEELDTKYILVFLFDESTLSFGFTFFDLSTLQFHLGQFTDDSMLSKFRTLVARVRPVEVVCSSRLKTSAPACVLRA